MLTLENTSETIKRVQTYLDRDMTSSDTPTAVLQAHTSESKTILTLKTELAEIKTAHTKETTTQGHQMNNKCRREGGPRTDPKDVVKCKTCGWLHRGQCWVEGEQKRAQGLALLKEAEGILTTKKNSKPSTSEIKVLEAAVVVNKDHNSRPKSCNNHEEYNLNHTTRWLSPPSRC